MKSLILALAFLFVLFEAAYGSPKCLVRHIKQIESCYHEAYGDDLSWRNEKIILPLLLRNVSKAFWQPICKTKHNLGKCITKSVIDRCFNINNMKRLSFVRDDALAKLYISAFIETDHICDFKFSDDDYNCFKELFSQTEDLCPGDTSTCETLNASLNCIVKTTYKKCGKVVGCFERKNAALMSCWGAYVFGCDVCDGISVKNNQIDGLCDDDNVKEIDIDQNPMFF